MIVRSLALVLSCAALSGTVLAQQEPRRTITQIAGDLYRFQNNFHYSVFLVTPEGVIATDPIDAEAAEWLRVETWPGVQDRSRRDQARP